MEEMMNNNVNNNSVSPIALIATAIVQSPEIKETIEGIVRDTVKDMMIKFDEEIYSDVVNDYISGVKEEETVKKYSISHFLYDHIISYFTRGREEGENITPEYTANKRAYVASLSPIFCNAVIDMYYNKGYNTYKIARLTSSPLYAVDAILYVKREDDKNAKETAIKSIKENYKQISCAVETDWQNNSSITPAEIARKYNMPVPAAEAILDEIITYYYPPYPDDYEDVDYQDYDDIEARYCGVIPPCHADWYDWYITFTL